MKLRVRGDLALGGRPNFLQTKFFHESLCVSVINYLTIRTHDVNLSCKHKRNLPTLEAKDLNRAEILNEWYTKNENDEERSRRTGAKREAS